MQQIPTVPAPRPLAPRFDVAPVAETVAAPGASQKVIVSQLRVKGAKAYSESDLLAQAGFVPGSELSLADLRAMANRITSFYRSNGYFVAQAYLPAQTIENGAVTMVVSEGEYGKITLNNQTNVSTSLANSLLDGLNSADPVTTDRLENRLLLLSDLPGVKVKATLLPGAATGTSDLLVDLTPGQRFSGSVDADNAGNRYTGEYRVGATLNFNEPLGLGDVASLRLLTSGGGLNYARASYQLQFGKATLGVAYIALAYELGEEFASLQATGTVRTTSLYGSYPLVRTRNSNLTAGLLLDDKVFQGKIGTPTSVSDKKVQVLTASLRGDSRDFLGGGGLNSFALAVSAGNVDLQTPAVQAIDAATARSNGHFNKLTWSISRVQWLGDQLSLVAAANGQFASSNLDVSEKMELGGMYGVRAYPQGEAYADQGYVASLEARYQLPNFSESLPGQFQLIGFVDVGTVYSNRNPWSVSDNRRTLSAAGVGFNWSDTNNFMVRAYYAVKLGDEVAQSAPDRSGRFWIQAVKYF
jgi:hemolysin activation/secretion protein